MLYNDEEFRLDLKKFREKFQFPFYSENGDKDFVWRYKFTIDQIREFCELEFKWFVSDQMSVRTIFDNIYKLTSYIIMCKLENDDENAIDYFKKLMINYTSEKENGGLSLDEERIILPGDFFRIRRSELVDGKRKIFHKNDLFHINYKERRKCKNFRFSISGTPALYLGEGIELCVKETFSSNEISEYYVSLFRNKEFLRVVTIGSIEPKIKQLLSDTNPFMVFSAFRFFAYLPFSIACLFKTPPPHDHNFSPEYIVPQMLMSYIKNSSDFHGVRYPSTKFDYYHNEPVFNYAFPVKEPDIDGFCRILKEKFD